MLSRHALSMAVLLAFCSAGASAATYAGWTVGNADGGFGTILYTTDSGGTWSRQGVGQLAEANLAGVSTIDANTAWVVGYADATGYATVYHTADAGQTWRRFGGGASALAGVDLVKVATWGDSQIWAVGRDGSTGTNYGVVVHSSDGGTTWTRQYTTTVKNQFQGICTVGGTDLWATGGLQLDDASGEIFAMAIHSDDGGATWTRQTGGDIQKWSHINGISAADASQVWAIAGFANDGSGLGNSVIASDDGGTTWTRELNGPGGVYDGNEIDVLDANVIWAVNDTDVLRSTDGGANWDTFPQNATYIMGVSGVSELEAWACLQGDEIVDGQLAQFGEIYHTSDGGQTWQTYGGYASDIPPLWTIDMVPVPEPTCLGMVAAGGLALLRRRRKRRA